MLCEYASHLRPDRKIIIGESATRLREGEPLTHPDFFSIMKYLRRTFPHTLIQLTTNGVLFDEAKYANLAELQPVEVILSLNSASKRGRLLLMGGTEAECGLNVGLRLNEHEIPYHGSIVALPHLVGKDDLTEAVKYLAENGAQTVRLLFPGFTRLSDAALIPPPIALQQTLELALECRARFRLPVLLEPPVINNLQALVEGVLPRTPAAEAGIEFGDRILSVEGFLPQSRVEAFHWAEKYENPVLKVASSGVSRDLVLVKAKKEKSGLVMAYDLDPRLVRQVEDALAPGGKTLMLTSKPALKRWIVACERYKLDSLELVTVESRFFGGTIEAAGLLTVSDFQQTLHAYSDWKTIEKVVFPLVAFDCNGYDLCGVHYDHIRFHGRTCCPV